MFSRVFKTTVTALLEGGDDAMTGPQLANFTKMVSVKPNPQGWVLSVKGLFWVLWPIVLVCLLHAKNKLIVPIFSRFIIQVCHSEHTYLYSMVVLHLLAQEPKGGPIVKRLMQVNSSLAVTWFSPTRSHHKILLNVSMSIWVLYCWHSVQWMKDICV